MATTLSDFEDLAWALHGPAKLVIAVDVALLVLAAFSVVVGGLTPAAELVLLLATTVNVVSLAAAIGVLVACRRYDRRHDGRA